MEPILEISHLSITFTQYERGIHKHKLPVIKDLSLQIQPGQIVAAVGASGSGKSLLAHSILGILPYNSQMSGTIKYDSRPLTQERAEAFRGREIMLVPQGITYLDPLMKIGPQIRKGKKSAGIRDRYRAALNRYGLGEEIEKQYPFELSGGMARRVLIASAVTESPRLIIADEPTPGLDKKAAGKILGHFRKLAEEGVAILFITHDLELALTVADRVAVFFAGETIEKASASDFTDVEKLRHPFTKALWHAMPEHGFHPLSGAQPYPGTMAKGCLFAKQCRKCTPLCLEMEQIPMQPYHGGQVRCLYPGKENAK